MRLLLQSCRSRRSGTTLVEATVAIALMGAIVAALIPVLSRTTAIREQVDRREIALEAVANLLERAATMPELSDERLLAISAEMIPDNRLPLPTWVVRVQPDSSMTRVEVTLSWQHREQVRSSVSLVRWYPGGQP